MSPSPAPSSSVTSSTEVNTMSKPIMIAYAVRSYGYD